MLRRWLRRPVNRRAATEAAAPEAAAGEAPEQVIIGGFDVGPGGDPQVIPYFNGAGTTWMSKLYTPLVMMSSDFSETDARKARCPRAGKATKI